MFAMIGLEVFAVVPNSQRRAPLQGNAPWVAEISGLTSQGKFFRNFVQGDADYTHANSVGSRGVLRWYHLRSGCIYEVAERLTWKRSVQYFCRVDGNTGDIIRMTRQEVLDIFQPARYAAVPAISRGVSDDRD